MKRPVLAVVGLAVIVAALMGIASVQATSDILSVDIDIKPGKETNSIKLNVPTSRGLIPVAILGGTAAPFDVTDVNVSTLAFPVFGAAPAHDLTDPFVYADHLQDVNDDGYIDLVSHYRTTATNIAPGETTACLMGNLNDGTPILGCDSIRTIPSS